MIAKAGAQYVGPTHTHMQALAQAFGVGTFKTYNDGQNVQSLRGQRALPGLRAAADPDVQQALIAAVTKLDPMAAEVPINAPWKAKHAAEWDAMTLEDWARANITTDIGREFLVTACDAVSGAEPSQMSLLYRLVHRGAGNEHTKGSFASILTTTGGLQDSRFVGGSQLVSEKVAHALGSQVVLGFARAPRRAGRLRRARDERQGRGAGQAGDRGGAPRAGRADRLRARAPAEATRAHAPPRRPAT